MRICIHCKTKMTEGYVLESADMGGKLCVRVRGRTPFRKRYGPVSCAVCPKCGYIEPYLEPAVLAKKGGIQ